MPFRGYFSLNGIELINTSRTMAHLGFVTPTSDVGTIRPIQRSLFETPLGSNLYMPAMYETPAGSQYYEVAPWDFTLAESPPGSGLYQTGECSLVEASNLLYEIPPTSERIDYLDGFYSAPDGGSLYADGLILVEDCCWGFARACIHCRPFVNYDDSWPELREYLQDPVYRTQLAPWHSTRLPESTEFVGLWVMDVKGLGPVPVQRQITEMVGSGGTAGPHRDMSRTITFDALMLACTHAGLEYGVDWLGCRLRETTGDANSTLRFLNAHPSFSGANPLELLREVHGVVLTKAPEITDEIGTGRDPHQQATMARVSWEMTATIPYLYLPPVKFDVEWDEIIHQWISWVHDVGCDKPMSCEKIPVLFSAECKPEVIDLPYEPPPVCGGCMPLCALESYVYYLPTLTYPVRCRETVVSMTVRNMQPNTPLTMQLYWQSCNENVLCRDFQFPCQISGLPASFDLVLDGVRGRYWAELRPRANVLGAYTRGGPAAPVPGIGKPRPWRPVGIVGTPDGSPWRPPVLDRQDCWQLVAVAPEGSQFEVTVSLIDRDP